MYEEDKIQRRYVDWLPSHSPLAESGEVRYLFKDRAIFTILFCLLIILQCSFFYFIPFPLYHLVSSCLFIFLQGYAHQLLSRLKFIGDKVEEKYASKWMSCVSKGINPRN